MQEKFTWKGFKIALIGVLLVAIALFINTDVKLINNFSKILMLIGIVISFVGIILHNKEMFKTKNKN
ncbi:MAG: hypothetical protein JJE30_13230 [Desulfuromonadales bacterium]|nr:hypothetical protein [Desulfuromonadales bacterium]